MFRINRRSTTFCFSTHFHSPCKRRCKTSGQGHQSISAWTFHRLLVKNWKVSCFVCARTFLLLWMYTWLSIQSCVCFIILFLLFLGFYHISRLSCIVWPWSALHWTQWLMGICRFFIISVLYLFIWARMLDAVLVYAETSGYVGTSKSETSWCSQSVCMTTA